MGVSGILPTRSMAMADSADNTTPREVPYGDFVQLYSRYQRAIYGYIYTMVPHHADAEDLLSETSLTLWEKFGDFEPGTEFLAWACRIAHYKILNFRKARARQPAMFGDELLTELASTRLARNDKLQAYRDALGYCQEKLSDNDRQLLDLCYDGTRAIKEAAGEVGRPVASVYTSLTRIRQRLLDCIRRKAGEGDER